jgi:hypothetical protein
MKNNYKVTLILVNDKTDIIVYNVSLCQIEEAVRTYLKDNKLKGAITKIEVLTTPIVTL